MNETPTTMTDMIHIKGYRPIGESDQGKCDRCGREGLKRTVAMGAVDQDGLVIEADSFVVHWGVCCAASYAYGSKSSSAQARVMNSITAYQEHKDFVERQRIAMIATSPVIEWTETRSTPSGFLIREKMTANLGDIRNAANRKFAGRGRPRIGSYLMANDEGHEVRVCPDVAGEVAFYVARGFRQVTDPVDA